MAKEVCLSWNSHGKILSSGLWKFFQENYRTDLDLSLSGHYFKVHHLILAVFSPLIKESEMDKFIKGDCLPIDKEDLQYLIEFMYCGKINVPENRLPYILKSAEALGFEALANVVQKYISARKIRIPAKLSNVKQSVRPAECKTEPVNEIPSLAIESKTEVEKPNESVSETDAEKAWMESKGTSLTKLDYSTFDPASLQFLCKYCNDGFDIFVDYANHMREFHDTNLPHKCPHCMHRTKIKSSLVEHLASKHQVDKDGNKLERNIQCDKCSFTCCAKFQLKHHIYICHTTKKSKCQFCNYAAVSKACLKKHVRLAHTNERPFMCETCGSRFKTFHTFRNHAMMHAGKKRMCELCGANISVHSFRAHMKTHSDDEKPFPCNLCSFAARKRYNLKVHLKNVHKVTLAELEPSGNRRIQAEDQLFDHQTMTEALMTISGDDYGINS